MTQILASGSMRPRRASAAAAALPLAALLLLLLLALPRARAQGAFRLLPLGDSIALGSSSGARPPSWPSGDSAQSGGWRSALYFALVDSGVPDELFQFVGSASNGPDEVPAAQRAHEGHPGWTCAQLTAIADAWVALAPDAILLMCGTNDSNHGNNASTFTADMTALLAVTAAARRASAARAAATAARSTRRTRRRRGTC